MASYQYYGHDSNGPGSLPYPSGPTAADINSQAAAGLHDSPSRAAFAQGSQHHHSGSDPYDYFEQSQVNAPSSHVPGAPAGSSHLYRQPTQSTVSPWDSVSNYPADELSQTHRAAPHPMGASGVGQYNNSHYLSADPYARASQASFGPSPYDDHDHDDLDHNRDTSSLPLVPNAAALSNTDKASHMPGLTPYDQQYDFGEDESNKYPPQGNNNKRESASRGADGQGILQELEQARQNRPPWWQRQIRDTTPVEDKIAYRQQGIGVQQRPWVCWVLTLSMIVALVVTMVKQAQATGTPIAIKPQFNAMIGPSSAILIQNGARFTPCMKETELIDQPFSCANNTKSTPTETCSLEDMCGFGGFDGKAPDQTFRFVLPIWLHAGVVHALLNLLAQCLSSAEIEREMGGLRFTILYMCAGIFGNILGASYSLIGIPSVGASGAIFGTHAALLYDLIAHWKLERAPKRKLLFLLIEIIIGIGIGFIPFVDNFAHVGGFAMGLMFAILLYPTIHQGKRRKFTIYGVRVVALVGVILLFVLITRAFNSENPNESCSWCRYISCWPTDSNNHCKGTGLKTTETDTSSSLVPALTVIAGHYLRKRL